ncbi:MAG: asparagine synthase (glutamine-hydrolyzing) [Solirubrobacteraceae bacterium]|nr:asparagine synthase (glutamine-hydrolyzing) [Solirubrobacteraceae bacterium]
MCGIAGFRGESPARATQLSGALAHRGPDGAWTLEHGGTTLVQTRLAVMDLSDRVRYPMLSRDGTVALVFNGEIYGFGPLRDELSALGHRFDTTCDAEVVLRGYEAWGAGVLSRIDGMYALALANAQTGELLLARDPLGIKPLVRTTGPGPVAFASDALALVAAGFSEGSVDRAAIAAHLALHYVPPPLTGIEDVSQVEPGTLVRIARDGSTTVEVFAVDHLRRRPDPVPVTAEEVRSTVSEAVAQQSRADVPVGVFLSGGVDSALILSAAVAAGHEPIAFTLGFEGSGDYDELALAKATARALGVPHHTEILRGGLADVLDEVSTAFDLPFADSSAIATVQLATLARREVTVALSGTGGDELFGGYARHRAHRLLRPLRAVPGPVRRRAALIGPARGSERSSRAAVMRSRIARLSALDPADPLDQYLGLIGTMTSPAAAALTTVTPELPASMRRPLDPTNSVLREVSRLDLATYLPGDVLTKEDRATMAVGLESRVPLLANAMFALSGRMRDDQKIGLREGKRALRRLATEMVPDRGVATAPKRGFAVPLGQLFDGAWHAEAADRLRAAQGVVVGDRAADAFLAGALSPAETWLLLTLDAWEQRLDAARVSGARAAALA